MTDIAEPLAAPAEESRFNAWRDRKAWRDFTIGIPYFWLLVFFLLPFFIILAISFATATGSIPPYTFGSEWPYVDLGNYARIFSTRCGGTAVVVSSAACTRMRCSFGSHCTSAPSDCRISTMVAISARFGTFVSTTGSSNFTIWVS